MNDLLTPERIRDIRLTLGKNQAEFGAMLGVNQSSVSRLETGSYTNNPPRGAIAIVLSGLAKKAEVKAARDARKASETAG